jgi:glutamate synthase domain-containing protein 3
MNSQGTITVHGSAGPGVGENMMSGAIVVKGDASQYAGATGRGGLLVIEGNASSRCGISMKGIDIVVKGSVGHMSAFMAQAGNLIVFGDAGDSLGDSIYEARLFVRGKVKSLGADCIEKEMRDLGVTETSRSLGCDFLSQHMKVITDKTSMSCGHFSYTQSNCPPSSEETSSFVPKKTNNFRVPEQLPRSTSQFSGGAQIARGRRISENEILEGNYAYIY